MLEAVDTIDELKFEDPFSSLTPLDFEDIVLKVLYTKPDIASKVFPKLSRTSFMNDANGELVELTKKFFKEHSRYPGPQEFYDLYIKDANIKEKFRNLGLVKVHKYDDAYIKAKVQEFVRMRLTFSRLMEASARLREDGNVNAVDAKTIEGFSEAVSFALESQTGISAKKDMKSFVDYLNKKHAFIPTFSPSLNALIGGGYASKALTVWYGESNMGKTTFLCNDAAYAFSQGYDVVYITLEMDKQEIMKKIIANLLEIPVECLKDYGEEFYAERLREISTSDLRILEWNAFEVNSTGIEEAIKELAIKEDFKPHIIFLDYINCMSANKTAGGKKHEELGYVTKELENISKNLDVPIVTCSQFNRNAYGNTKPSAKDVGESIDIYKYSANGIAITRDPTMVSTGLYELNIIKNRYGPKDKSFLVRGFNAIMKFRDAHDGEIKSYTESTDELTDELVKGARDFPR